MEKLNDYEMLDLSKKLCNMFLNKHLRLKKSFEFYEYTDCEIIQSYIDELNEFMSNEFAEDWENNEQAKWFYECVACDLRLDAENDSIELYHSI